MPQDDKFGIHECLDRTSIIMDMVSEYLMDHKGLNNRERRQAYKIHANLFSLYQRLGKRHMGE